MEHHEADPQALTTKIGEARRAPAAWSRTADPTNTNSNPTLAVLLRRSLDDARGNPRIRERLAQLAQDSARIDAIVRTLGARHALVRDLSRLGARPDSAA